MTLKLLVLPGDGIGPEITAATLSVLNVGSLIVNPVAYIPTTIQPLIAVVPSAIVRRAYIAYSLGGSLITINTDPTMPPPPATPLAWTPFTLKVGID